MASRTDVNIRLYYVEEVANLFHQKYTSSPFDAAKSFVGSKTYKMLANPDMEMWEFGPEGIFSIWESELITGDPRNSSYIRGEAV